MIGLTRLTMAVCLSSPSQPLHVLTTVPCACIAGARGEVYCSSITLGHVDTDTDTDTWIRQIKLSTNDIMVVYVFSLCEQ